MTDASDLEGIGPGESDPKVSSGPILLNGLPTRRPAVLDERDGLVVVWQVNLTGNPSGAWVLPYEGAGTARSLLAMLDRRALIAVDSAVQLDRIMRWAEACDVSVD